MKNKIYKLPNGRVAYDFPWESHASPRPWKNGYSRVIIPLTASEQRGARRGTKCHTQIVKNSKLHEVKEPRLQIRMA